MLNKRHILRFIQYETLRKRTSKFAVYSKAAGICKLVPNGSGRADLSSRSARAFTANVSPARPMRPVEQIADVRCLNQRFK